MRAAMEVPDSDKIVVHLVDEMTRAAIAACAHTLVVYKDTLAPRRRQCYISIWNNPVRGSCVGGASSINTSGVVDGVAWRDL